MPRPTRSKTRTGTELLTSTVYGEFLALVQFSIWTLQLVLGKPKLQLFIWYIPSGELT